MTRRPSQAPTPHAIRHYYEIGLLPGPERGGDDRRHYGHEDMIRLLWVRKVADAGIALDDVSGAFPPAEVMPVRCRGHPGELGGHPRRAGGRTAASTDRCAADGAKLEM
ncbi:MerR family transcriptional regulator [Actinokineospora guangxiensis]|uniref:MerR family transcriptional regulator n=1 Tax=Actinokineospora guangxiensis TaxID=1490288 RepID=A0ABW0ERU3_9PSEU